MDINRIINIVKSLKEEASITNAVGTDGLTSSSTPVGRMDGYDKVMGKMVRKRGPIIGLGRGSRNRWKKPQ